MHDIIRFMARRGRSGSSADPGLAGPNGAGIVFLFGFVCLVLGVVIARLVTLMDLVHPEFGRAWLPMISAGCAVSVGWAWLYAAAIWRFPGRRRVQWIGYAYAFATIALTAPFFPRTLAAGYSFTTRLPEGSPPPLLDRLMLGAMAFAAAGITITVLAVLFGRPLARLESRRLSSWAAASSVLHVQARLREFGPAGPGPWRQGELRLAPGSVTWSMSRSQASVDLTGARFLTAGSQARARVGRARTVLVVAAAGRFEVGVRPELLQEFITLADHFRPWRDQDPETVDRGPASWLSRRARQCREADTRRTDQSHGPMSSGPPSKRMSMLAATTHSHGMSDRTSWLWARTDRPVLVPDRNPKPVRIASTERALRVFGIWSR